MATTVATNALGLLEDGSLDPAWASDAFGFSVESGRFVHGAGLDGGQSGTMRRLEVVRPAGADDAAAGSLKTTYVIKHSDGNPQMPGGAREADFYNVMAKDLGLMIPSCIYASGDRTTGEKILVLEDLAAGIPVGYMIGVSHPYTWGAEKEAEVLANTAAGPGPVAAIKATFEAAAELHAKYWGSESIQTLAWIDSNRNEQESAWQRTMGWSQSVWASKRGGVPGLTIDPVTVAVIDASFAKLSWADHQAFKQKSATTLIQGDFHPYNAMWMDGRVVLYDWEMIKAGSAGQELGQFMLGNIDIELRRSAEKGLVAGYRTALIERGVDEAACTAEGLWDEYVFGGAAKWAWLMPIMFTFIPEPNKMQWFLDQFAAFVADHGVTPENVPQPRS